MFPEGERYSSWPWEYKYLELTVKSKENVSLGKGAGLSTAHISSHTQEAL